MGGGKWYGLLGPISSIRLTPVRRFRHQDRVSVRAIFSTNESERKLSSPFHVYTCMILEREKRVQFEMAELRNFNERERVVQTTRVSRRGMVKSASIGRERERQRRRKRKLLSEGVRTSLVETGSLGVGPCDVSLDWLLYVVDV